MSDRYRVHIDEYTSFVRNAVRVLLVEGRGEDLSNVMFTDGTWRTIPNDAVPLPEQGVEAGILIPRAFLEPLRDALDKLLGETRPSEAEVRVLREALNVERNRVNDALRRHTDTPSQRN